jgi:predicted DNA-binding ribbon-helix-helix protein
VVESDWNLLMNESNSSTLLHPKKLHIVRVQTGVRIEVRMLKVLKALAEYFDLSLGDLLEGIVLHAFEGKSAFNDEETLRLISTLKEVYKMDYDATVSHCLFEENS